MKSKYKNDITTGFQNGFRRREIAAVSYIIDNALSIIEEYYYHKKYHWLWSYVWKFTILCSGSIVKNDDMSKKNMPEEKSVKY